MSIERRDRKSEHRPAVSNEIEADEQFPAVLGAQFGARLSARAFAPTARFASGSEARKRGLNYPELYRRLA